METNNESRVNPAVELGAILADLQGFEICHEPWWLYYDETGNWRSISYKNGRVPDTRAFERDFILGGILVTNEEAILKLREGLKSLPAPNGEIKSKSVLSGSKDFWRVLRRKETTDFLNLIDSDGIAVHYHAQDNLYYSIVDIVDSLLMMPEHRACSLLDRELKNELYLCALHDHIFFLNKLASFGYPNIKKESVRPFCEFLLHIITLQQSMKYPSDEAEGFLLETLRRMVKAASKNESLVLLLDNNENALVEDFSSHYTMTCMLLPNAMHTFDKELHVSMALAEPLHNYAFVDSKNEPLIQLSDVWVGFLSRLFAFLDEWVSNPIIPDDHHLQSQEMTNLRTAKKLIDRSSDIHRSLISNVGANATILGRENSLSFLCSL